MPNGVARLGKLMTPRHLHARDLLVRIDRSGAPGVGRQLEEQLRNALRSGTLTPGSDLPSTRALAEDLSVSRGVVVRAYAQLAAEGYLDLRQGASSCVRGIPFAEPERAPEVSPPPEQRPKLRYDLRAHKPELSGFPRHAWLRSLRRALLSAADADLGYIEDRCGLEQLRTEISRYLGRARGVAADPARVVVTAGSTHTLSLISRVLARRGASSIGFENPSHWLLHAVAQRAGLAPVGIPVDRHGLRLDELSAGNVGAVVVSPAHQFPTGAVLSADRRTELVRWARESGVLIIEDEYDAEFRYDRAPIGALQGLSPEQVAYIGSTGKTLSPGIRLGWVVLPSELVANVGEELFTTVLHVSGIDQLALADFVRRGEFDRHLRRMRTVYRRRRDALVGALETQLPLLPVSGIAAGLHVVVELPSTASETAACEQARARGLAIESLSQHALPGYGGPPGLLIGYGDIPEPSIPFAIDQLAQVLGARRQAGAARATGKGHRSSRK
jgi:GntR family transcriptional regulator/MocR family aminotransferase